jgi:ubiquinone/menaquinone biosynthesis C-methylase UbiE
MNLTTRQADANNLPFPDRSFDLITSRFGVMNKQSGSCVSL